MTSTSFSVKSALLLITAALLLFMGLGSLSPAQARSKVPHKVRIALLNGPSALGLIGLKTRPVFSNPEIQADVQILGAPRILMGQMLKQEWDAAVLPANMAALLYNKGLGYQVCAVTGMGSLYLLTDKSLTPETLSDLKNQTLHIPGKNTTPDLILQILAQKRQISLSPDYRFNPSDLARALAAGLVKAAVLPEPFVSQALGANKNLHIAFDLQKLWADAFTTPDTYPLTVLVVRSDFAAKHPGLVADLLQAARASLERVCSQPLETARLVRDHGLTLDLDKTALARANHTFVQGERMKLLMDFYFEQLMAVCAAAIGSQAPDTAFYYQPKTPGR